MVTVLHRHRLNPADDPGIELVGDGGEDNQDLHRLQPPQGPPKEIGVVVELFNRPLHRLDRFTPDAVGPV